MVFRQVFAASCSPTLLALALYIGAGSGSLQAATAEERDQHFLAIVATLDKDFRLTGERQRAAFAQLAYPDDAWFRKALEWYAALKAKGSTNDPAKVATLEKTVSSVRAELDAAEEAGKLPPAVARMLQAAGSQTALLLKDLATFMSPDSPPPLATPGPDRVAIAQNQIQNLIAAASKEWAKAVAKIKANETNEKGIWDGNDQDPKVVERIRQATMLRFEAVKVIYNAHSGLREVITRGSDFGLDPKPAQDFFRSFMKENLAAIADWEYTFGDYFPYLRAYASTVEMEGMRQLIPNQKIDDLEAGLVTTTAFDTKHAKTAADREDLIQLKLKAWIALLRSRLEIADAVTKNLKSPKPNIDPKGKNQPDPAMWDQASVGRNLDKGLEYFENFKDEYKGQKEMTPAATNTGRAWYIGQLWLVAARLQLAKGNSSAAAALFGEVAANKASYASVYAQGWLAAASGSKSGGSDWGKPSVAMDPAQALNVAKALRKEADHSVDPKLKRSQLLAAAIQLRNGVLGLSGGWQDSFVDAGPEVYELYARTLSELELHYHSALVAEEGLRAVAARVGKDNPWKKGTAWTDAGKNVQRLVKNSMVFASQLSVRAKSSGVAAMQTDVIELVKKIDPDSAGQSAEETLIVNSLQDREWERTIQMARAYLKKYPTAQPKAYAWIIGAYSGWYDELRKAKDETKSKQVAADLAKAASDMETEAKAELAKKPDAAREKDWMRVLSTVQTAKLSTLLADEKNTDVITTFGSEFWKNPPADETLRGRVLRGLCTAVGNAEAARVKDEKAKGDPQSLLAAYQGYADAYAAFRKFLPSIKDPVDHEKTLRFGKNMVNAFNTVSVLADGLSKQPNSPAQLPEIAKAAKRAAADLLEPNITEKDKPGTIFFCATILWELDEHERALRLYELFQRVIDADADLAAFLANPKPALDAVDDNIGKRPEVAGDWAKTRDLVEDKPELKDLKAQGEPPEKWGEKPANFSDALVSLAAFKTKADAQVKTKLGADGWAKADASIKALEKLLTAAVQKIDIKSRLALGYRETGKADKARQLYSELYEYDSENLVYAAAYVDIVLDQVRAGGNTKKDDLEKARDIARKIRDNAGKNLDLSWQATTQVMELSLALGDSKTVNEGLKFNAVNHSGPSYDLIQPPIMADDKQVGDDKRVRRARNALAVELTNRYWALYKGNGVTEKAESRIDQLTAPDGTVVTIFVPNDAPKFEIQTVPNVDDVDVSVIVEQGTVARKAATAAAPAPAANAPVAAPAPVSATAAATTPAAAPVPAQPAPAAPAKP